ncbi:MAG: class I SAM-dependent methyltransferase [Myxococcota bacterium]
MTEFIRQAVAERRLGLALHYPLLHAAVVGMNAHDTFEFGAGGSTRVILDALPSVRSYHWSVSTETECSIRARYGICPNAGWSHKQSTSETARAMLNGHDDLRFDIALHDGSHAADVVAADIAWMWPRLKHFGLLLVHDTQHSYCGAEVRSGVIAGLRTARAIYTATTLPFGFGLTVVRREDGDTDVVPAPTKMGSAHSTMPLLVCEGSHG